MKKLDEMNSFSCKLWFDKRWVTKSGIASLYLQVTINGKHKEFPLKLKWPAKSVDLAKSLLKPDQAEKLGEMGKNSCFAFYNYYFTP